jgi:hypothetical protein
MTTATDTLAVLNLTFDPELGALLDVMPEERSWWWMAAHTTIEHKAWSAAFLHDLVSVVNARTGFPWIVCGDAGSGRWFQVFGEPEACTVELSIPGDTNAMAVLGIPGESSKMVEVFGGEHTVVIMRRQVLTLAAAHAALDSWVLGSGNVPEGFDIRRVHY